MKLCLTRAVLNLGAVQTCEEKMNYNLIPGSVFVPYKLRDLFNDKTLANARVVVIGRGIDERIIGWFIKIA